LVHSLDPNEGGVSSSVYSLNGALNELGAASVLCDNPKSINSTQISDRVLNVVHGLWQWPSRLAQTKKSKIQNPYLIFPHGMLDPWFRKTYPWKHIKKQLYWWITEHMAIRHADAVCFTTREEMNLARSTFTPYKAYEKVVGLGVDDPPVENLQIRSTLIQRFPSLKERKILLYLGRFHEKKGLDMLLHAWVQNQSQETVLVLAGPNHERTGYVRILENLGEKNKHNIIWTGMLGVQEKWEMLRLSNALILPSHQENFGMVVAESLAVGKPVYITNKVNLWREVAQANAGMVVNDDQEGINTLVNQWLTQSNTEMRKAAEPCFLENFHIRKTAENLINLAENIYSS
jgi:glycosyltransferase involved in cell wall biosynthesis